jgi:hypothetical protein
MKRKITTLLFAFCTFFLLNAQKFVPLTDASGIGLTTGQLTSLENAAQEAVNILPATDQPLFRVYDVGFYVHTPATIGGIPEVWEQVMTNVENDPSSDYYLILGRESSNEWEDAKARATAVDYVEYWVILTDDFGKSYLYSRFTIGEFVPVAARGDGFDESRGMVAVSPWGLALKALGNAAVDAVVQAVIMRIVDPGANDWGTAWGKVSYLGAAWEGISILLPWKKDLASTLVRTATSAFAVVLDNALNIPDYTVQQGLVDFGVGFAASGITQLVTHPKTVEKIGIGSVYAKLAFTKGIKRIEVQQKKPVHLRILFPLNHILPMEAS